MVLTDETVVLRIGGGSLRINGCTSDGSVSPGNFGKRTPCMEIVVGGISSRNILLTASSQSCNNCCT